MVKKKNQSSLKREKKFQKKESRISLNIKTQRLIIAIVLFILAIILFLGLVSLAGVAGDFLVLGIKIAVGWASWLVPFVLAIIGLMVLNFEKVKSMNGDSERKYPSLAARSGSLIFLILMIAGLFHLSFVNNQTALIEHQGGGYLGYALSYVLSNTFGLLASWVIFLGAIIISLIIILIGFFNFKKDEEGESGDEDEIEEVKLEERGLFKNLFQNKKEKLVLKPEAPEKILAQRETEPDQEIKIKRKNIFAKEKDFDKDGEMAVSYKKINKKIDLPLELLASESTEPDAGNVEENRYIIKKTLENFNIPVEMGEIKIGPTVAQYTLKPAQGVKLSKITSLHNDLSLALAAHPIRIEAPIPGQSLVGIEVPNQKVATIRLRKILSDQIFIKRKSNLSVALGRDVAGNIWLADIARMPHCLVAGSTGSGKTIFLNAIIISLIYQNSPDDLKFILVDPKRVELTLYNDLPHLLTPVITNTQKTVNALKWAVNEMERRFDIMAEAKKRDIQSYNESHPDDKLPFIVIIIDELADLMSSASQDVEVCIVRLAQMARATGIHLIMATQRPSVDVITGLIKANITARVAFSVASLMDSRTILDFSGAEKLLGRGDMLFMSSELSKPKRIQAAFVSDQEVKKIVEYLRNVTEPNFQEDITRDQKINNLPGEFKEQSDLKEDDLLSETRDLVIKTGKASASFLQRRLRVGYARAARLLDLLEEEGTIGPAEGAKAREVYRLPEAENEIAEYKEDQEQENGDENEYDEEEKENSDDD